MTTPRTRAVVSLAAATAFTLLSAACVRSPSRPIVTMPSTTEALPITIRFDNDAREHVHVYLIGDRREWLLGRVEPGAVTTLRIPQAALGDRSRFVRLAVITGDRVTLQAARDPRARFTVAQPASAMLLHQWKFAQGEITPHVP